MYPQRHVGTRRDGRPAGTARHRTDHSGYRESAPVRESSGRVRGADNPDRPSGDQGPIELVNAVANPSEPPTDTPRSGQHQPGVKGRIAHDVECAAGPQPRGHCRRRDPMTLKRRPALAKLVYDRPDAMSDDLTSLLTQALALHRRGELAAAEVLYRRALAIAPRQPDALHLLGVITAQRGQPDEAIPLLQAAVAEAHSDANMQANLARACKAAGRFTDALAAFDQALALGSIDPGVHNDRGNVLLDLDRAPQALDSFDNAIALRHDYAEAFCNRGNALRALNRHPEALDNLDHAIALKPGFADAHSNRGNVLQDLDRHEEAVASYAQALALQPDHLDALVNRGVALRALGRHTLALGSYESALALRPTHTTARTNRSLCLLQTGDFAQGWIEHEWRLRMPTFAPTATRFADPPWRGGESLAGETILLHAEQGFGDTLQFCRYAPLVVALGARVVLEVGRPLARLLATLDGVAQVIVGGDPMPPIDRHCPLLSLPLAFRTTLDTIPLPASLRPDPTQVAYWQQRLAAVHGRRVGLVWEGSSLKRHPEGRAADRRRSLTLNHFAPLGRIPGNALVSLQTGGAAAQTAAPPPGLVAHDFTTELTDFADTAALISGLDLVITVDTAVAHLAGTLGKPVWILTQFDADWRWLLNRNDSPWYPSARLFRQSSFGDWHGVIAAVSAALQSLSAR
jgi:tetratricopeptide (TPR) repeat protein